MSSPIVYSTNLPFRITGTGLLPGYTKSPVVTWADVNQFLLTAKSQIATDYEAYLQADLDGDDDAKAIAVQNMNTTLASIANAITTLGVFSSVRLNLENNQSVIRASSDLSQIGVAEYGRTEILTAQQFVDTIANCVRTSSTTTLFTWYGAVSMGSFSSNSEFPAHILKIGCANNS